MVRGVRLWHPFASHGRLELHKKPVNVLLSVEFLAGGKFGVYHGPSNASQNIHVKAHALGESIQMCGPAWFITALWVTGESELSHSRLRTWEAGAEAANAIGGKED
jgi:hypothetical protein